MEILQKERKLCPFCMEEHDVLTVQFKDKSIFKGHEIEFLNICEYCEYSNEYAWNGDMLDKNITTIKNAYKEKIKQCGDKNERN